jgi:hypothetical protein
VPRPRHALQARKQPVNSHASQHAHPSVRAAEWAGCRAVQRTTNGACIVPLTWRQHPSRAPYCRLPPVRSSWPRLQAERAPSSSAAAVRGVQRERAQCPHACKCVLAAARAATRGAARSATTVMSACAAGAVQRSLRRSAGALRPGQNAAIQSARCPRRCRRRACWRVPTGRHIGSS